MISAEEYTQILSTLLKKGIKKYNSNKILSLETPGNKMGGLVGFYEKDLMRESIGNQYRSIDMLVKDSEILTHWTPNVYSWIGGGNGRVVWGHKEENLIQINTFVADIDFPIHQKKIGSNKLLMILLEEGLLPYLIVDTPKGYHVYFTIQNYNDENGKFDKPSFVSNANDYKSIKVAKRISMNIRKAIKNRLPQVDMGCNHFGVFRFPNLKNIVHFEPNFVDTFDGYLKWSKDFESKEHLKAKSKLSLVRNRKGKTQRKQIESKWYDFLIRTDIQEGDRNRAIFTMALACKSSGLDLQECIDQMDQISFSNDLSFKEVERTVRSAYKGNYMGASRFHINELLENYATPKQLKACLVDEPGKRLKGNRVDPEYWVKFAKSREERIYSHFNESQLDLLAYLESKQKKLAEKDLFLDISMSDISRESGIPLSSLKVILKQLKATNTIVLQTKRGRNGSTKIATKRFVEVKVLMMVIKDKKSKTNDLVNFYDTYSKDLVTAIVAKYNDKELPYKVMNGEHTRAIREPRERFLMLN